MGRAPCCDKTKVKRGAWSPEEDATLKNYLEKFGTGGNWISLPHKAGLKRCGKSCRLRWLNYLRPDIKLGAFTEEEDNFICTLYNKMGSRWSVIASQLSGRTDNDVKNHWNTKLKKKLMAAKSNNPTPSLALVPKFEAYNPSFSALLNQTVISQLESSSISGSSSLAMENNYGVSIDFGTGICYDLTNGIWCQETVLTDQAVNSTNSYANLGNSLYVDTNPYY